MTVEANKKIIHRQVEEVWNQGKLEVIPELIHPDFVGHLPDGNLIKGREGFRNQMIVLRTFAPDIHYSIDSLIAEGDIVVARYTSTGTFTGKYSNIEPTGKKFVQKTAIFHRFKDGKQVEDWSFWDTLSLYRQLGIPVPEPSMAAPV